MSNPVIINVLLGISELGADLNVISKRLMELDPTGEVSDETMNELQATFHKGIKAVTDAKEMDKAEVIQRILSAIIPGGEKK